MEVFDYEALDAAGKLAKGSISAESARAARQDLKARSLTPIKMKAAASGGAARQSGPSGRSKTKVSHSKLTQATRQLSILVRSGTPLTEALKITALQFEDSAVRQSFLDVRAGVTEGRTMSSVMRENPKTFNALYPSMVAAGEGAGQLGPVLERLAKDMESAQKVRRKVLGATIYPVVLSFVALAVIVVLMIFVVPRVVEQFDSFGQELPLLTRGVIAFSEWMQAYGLFVLIAAVIGVFLFRNGLKRDGFKTRWHRFILSLPMIGQLSRNLNTARFARTMAILINAGAVLPEALRASRRASDNLPFQDMMSSVIDKVETGKGLADALRQARWFPPLMVYMVAAGERSGRLAEMFQRSAEHMEAEVDGAITVGLSLLEPGIIIAMAVIVVGIVLSILLPILQLNTAALG